MILRVVGILFMGIVLANEASAAVILGVRPSDQEFTRLPPYCVVRYKSPQESPEWKSWRARIGKNFIDIHHYCSGLNFLNRYWGARTPNERRYYLERALSGFNYLVDNEKPDFALRGELYSNRGEVYNLMAKSGQAIQDLNHAIAVDPSLVKPYMLLAELYMAGNDHAHALEVATAGLRNIPDSKALQRRYLELGGKKPFPEPAAAEKRETDSAKPTKSESVSTTPTEPPPSKPVPPNGAQTAVPSDTPAIGSPSNPYCRFCPPE